VIGDAWGASRRVRDVARAVEDRGRVGGVGRGGGDDHSRRGEAESGEGALQHGFSFVFRDAVPCGSRTVPCLMSGGFCLRLYEGTLEYL